MNTCNPAPKSQEILDKVYDHLNSIDITKLPLHELEDFLGVVQKGRFLETLGKVPPYGFGLGPVPPTGGTTEK